MRSRVFSQGFAESELPIRPRVAALHCYPVKGCAGLATAASFAVTGTGTISVGDEVRVQQWGVSEW